MGDSVGVAVWKYFSYYTILSNILVCAWVFVLVIKPSQSLIEIANDANVASAITFYIVTVGVANYLIFGIPKLKRLDLLADTLVHAIVPAMTFIFWLMAISKESLSYALVHYWLLFPLSYAAYMAFHGVWTKFYPYPFTNIQELGVLKVAINAVGLSICVLIGGYFFIVLGKTLSGVLP